MLYASKKDVNSSPLVNKEPNTLGSCPSSPCWLKEEGGLLGSDASPLIWSRPTPPRIKAEASAESPAMREAPKRVKRPAEGKKRGSYRCSKCGLPKKGHVCTERSGAKAKFKALGDKSVLNVLEEKSDFIVSDLLQTPKTLQRRMPLRKGTIPDTPGVKEEAAVPKSSLLPHSHPPARALDLDDPRMLRARLSTPEHLGGPTGNTIRETLKRIDMDQQLLRVFSMLPAKDLAAVAGVSKRWRWLVEMAWQNVESATLVHGPGKLSEEKIRSSLRKASKLSELTIKNEGLLTPSILALVVDHVPFLRRLKVVQGPEGSSALTGKDLQGLVNGLSLLENLSLEGCEKVTTLTLESANLESICIYNAGHLDDISLKCPRLEELCIHTTTSMIHHVRSHCDGVDGASAAVALASKIGEACTSIKRLHLKVPSLDDEGLHEILVRCPQDVRYLSINDSQITDLCVKEIATSLPHLELLDLSGSGGITDYALDMICVAYGDSLGQLLLAACPQLSCSGIQRAASKLKVLALLDCGYSISAAADDNVEIKGKLASNERTTRQHGNKRKRRSPECLEADEELTMESLQLQSPCLKKVSLWGCKRIQAVQLECPELEELNLNQCTGLEARQISLESPKLRIVYAERCSHKLAPSLRGRLPGACVWGS